MLDNTQGIDYEIILVDNASTECNADDFLLKFPTITLIKSTHNGGFAYGNNLGIEKAKGAFILLLNSDTILTENTIEKSIKYFLSIPGAGVLGCRMVYPGGGLQYTARKFRSIGWELLDLFRFIPMMMNYEKRARIMLGKYFNHDKDIECDWVNGAFFLFTRTVLEKLPCKKLDDRFFMYGEDHLWCAQIKSLGFKILFFAGSTIVHISSASTGITKFLSLRKTMMKNEMEIMKWRKGKGLYYYLFKLLYGAKEGSRNFIKSIIYRLSGRMLR